MKQITWELPCLEFKDVNGIIRTTYGCTLTGRDEFWQRLEKLCSIPIAAKDLNPNVIADLYLKDTFFRHNCDRCLALNAIDPQWLDGRGVMLTSFLFTHEEGEALLVGLNLPQDRTPKPLQEGEKPGTTESIIAALSIVEGSFIRAKEVVESYPALQLQKILEERSDIIAEQSLSEEDRKKKAMETKAREAQKLMAGEIQEKGFDGFFGDVLGKPATPAPVAEAPPDDGLTAEQREFLENIRFG